MILTDRESVTRGLALGSGRRGNGLGPTRPNGRRIRHSETGGTIVQVGVGVNERRCLSMHAAPFDPRSDASEFVKPEGTGYEKRVFGWTLGE